MKKFLTGVLAAGLMVTAGVTSAAPANPSDPAEFAKMFRQYFYDRFPEVPHSKYNLGIYAIDKDAYSQYQDMMQFPPQDDYIAKGKKFWEDYRLPNGKPLSSCVGPAKGLRARYPYFNPKDGKVHNLGLDLIHCQENAGVPKDKSLGSKKGYKDLVNVLSYLASESRGMKIDVQIPNDPRAVAAFNNGKEMWFRKTGRLNQSCADCHMYHSGQFVRAEHLHGGIGNTVAFPVYRYSKQKMFTLEKRLHGCMRDTGTIPYKAYSTPFLDLEYFLAYIDNGLVINGPGLRK